MKPVTALLVDDEIHNRNTLRALLLTHCPEVQLVAEASSADEAFALISQIKPQLVFLDVMMPLKSGFELLKMFSSITFEVIFVSAFNEFAVTAFEYNALGYILKPIDYLKLRSTVQKAVAKIRTGASFSNVHQFINSLDPDNDQVSKIALHHNEKVVLVDIHNIVSVEAEEGISRIVLHSNEHYYSSKDLKLFEGIFKQTSNFVRISKSVLINLDHLKSYTKGDVCEITMTNNAEFEVSRRKKTEILQLLRLLA